jgi:hypothetical protein
MFACPGCGQNIIVGTLPPSEKRAGNWIVCSCRKSSFDVGDHVGDVQISCKSCGTRRVNTATSQVVATLATFGTVVMEFQQGTLLERVLGSDRVTKLELQNGACYGICLHWIRRQLFSQKVARHEFASDKSLRNAVSKGALAQVLAKRASGDWSTIVSAVDEAQKRNNSDKLLANIQRYSEGSQRGGEVRSYVEQVCGETAFQEGHCALITCHVSAGGRGHTVAVRKMRAGHFLFDPNYGIYDIQARLPDALHWVFCQDGAGIRATADTREISHVLFRES